MAIFEKSVQTKTIIDDTERLSCVVENAQNINKHTNYLNEVLKNNILALSLEVRSFLDPSNYPFSIAEQALQTVSIALRGDGRYDLKGPLRQIGWRIRKHYFLAAAGQHVVALTQLIEKPFTRVKTREITKIAIGIWSAKTTGALPRCRNRLRARRADGRVAGACRRDGRPWLNCRHAAYTARHPTLRAEPDTTERGSKEP
ncbi:PX domain-containing protein kinase-like protein [Eumeta japonica]|uniref:PX domain-containing protein kinase-like protein n=1 Tax=Eumeta variegata TaxID=151549 RepID=A0A4C1WWZ7_EUMVA|nr:PX domain-containing protein kinase-like protein [Eumeta japonica]